MNRDENDTADEAKEERLLFVILPIVIALVMLALVLAESDAPTFELRVTAPSRVAPGAIVPVRAEVLEGMERPEGPSVVRMPVRARLVDAHGDAVATTSLAASALSGAEGHLRAPMTRGPFTLVVSTDEAHGDMRVERRLDVSASARLATRERRAVAPVPGLGPIVSRSSEPAPSELGLSVEGGLCVPEVPCHVFVRVGAPATAIHIAPGATVTVERAPDGVERTGFVAATVTVRGPEPRITLVATRAGVAVAEREVALPAGRGGLRLVVPKRVLAPNEPARVAIESFDGPKAVAIDVLRDGVWVATTSIDARAARTGSAVRLPTSPGRYRLVARGDFVSDDAASSVFVSVGSAADARDPLAFAASVAEDEGRVVSLPPFTSAILQANTGAVQRRVSRRLVAAFVILICGAYASRRVTRRVQAASAQARAIMSAAGDEDASATARVNKDWRTSVIVGALVFVAFAFAALLVLSRSVI